LGDVSSQAFLTQHVGRDWLHHQAGPARAPGSLADLVSLRDLELLLFNAEGQDKLVRVAGGPATQPPEDDAPGGLCSADQALDAWAKGRTLIFNNIDRQLPAVHALARGLEGELKCRVWCNLYLTPARGRGLEVHYDSHDVFVLQLIGSKRWSLGARAADAPMPFQVHARLTRNDGEDGTTRLVLQRGDVLYMPRGQAHEAATEDDLSAHLTIGLYPKTYLDMIVTAAAIAADRDARFRESLPLGTFAADADVVDKARSLMALISDRDFAEVGEAFCELLASEQRRSPIDRLGLHGKDGRLSEHDRFRATANLMCSLSCSADAVELNAMGSSLSFPPAALNDLIRCSSGKVFCLKDIGSGAALEDRADFVRRLMFAGVVQRLRPADDPGDVPVDVIKHLQ
jgi:hypothetical protein